MTATAKDLSFANVFPPLWLRDNCPCEQCRDPSSHQKLFQLLDLPDDVEILGSSSAATRSRSRFFPTTIVLSSRAPGCSSSPKASPTSRAERGQQGALACGRHRSRRAEDHLGEVRRRRPRATPSASRCRTSRPRPHRRRRRPPRHRAGRSSQRLATCERPTTASSSTFESSPTRATSPSPDSRSPRTPTTRTAIQCRRCSSCTASKLRRRR